MQINVFCNVNDFKLHPLPLFSHPKVILNNIRFLQDRDFYNTSIVILSDHHMHQRMIHFIRKTNVLTPIILVSDTPKKYKEINASVHPSQLNYHWLVNVINFFPQQHIWNYVFFRDAKNRKLINYSSLLTV
tara:strand:- start:206 stop:598 length:393 start_codon:yes stop_codon:yes gene_type:complete